MVNTPSFRWPAREHVAKDACSCYSQKTQGTINEKKTKAPLNKHAKVSIHIPARNPVKRCLNLVTQRTKSAAPFQCIKHDQDERNDFGRGVVPLDAFGKQDDPRLRGELAHSLQILDEHVEVGQGGVVQLAPLLQHVGLHVVVHTGQTHQSQRSRQHQKTPRGVLLTFTTQAIPISDIKRRSCFDSYNADG